jgi:DNA-binding GntR family transcriptional regulator
MDDSMRPTIAGEISQQLSDEIVKGSISPGKRLEEQEIANRFKVSRTPVREALRHLAAMGLVEIRPRKGVTVLDIGVDQLSDMFEAMGELEALCARLAAQRMNAVERKKLEIIHERTQEAVKSEEEAIYSLANEEFHAAIYDGAHNASIKEITKNFRRRLAPFRATLFFKIPGRMMSSHKEHGDISSAIIDGDTVKAYNAMRNHVASSSLNVIDYLLNARMKVHGSGSGIGREAARTS